MTQVGYPAISINARSRAAAPPTVHPRLLAWVKETAELTRPASVHWCDGSVEEYQRLCQQLVDAGTFTRLSDAKRPNSYLARLTGRSLRARG